MHLPNALRGPGLLARRGGRPAMRAFGYWRSCVGRSCLAIGVFLRLVLLRNGTHSTQQGNAVGSGKRFWNAIKRGCRKTYIGLAVGCRVLHFTEQTHYVVNKTAIQMAVVRNVVVVGVLSVVVLVVCMVVVPRFLMCSNG